jgi:hypothetical protein
MYADASQNRTEPAATDPPVKATDPSNANPPKPETPQEKAWYQKAVDWTGDRFNEMGQAIQHPGEGLKGAAKEIGNMPAGLWNTMMLAGTAQAGSDLQQAAMFRSGPDGDTMMQLGQDMIQNPAKYAAPGMAEEPFMMSNRAQQGGANILNVLSTAVPIGGAAKALFAGAKDIGELGVGANLAANTAKDVGELRGGASLADSQFGTNIHSMVDKAYRALENPGKQVELPNGAYLRANRTIGGALRPDVFYVDPVKKQFQVIDIYTGAKKEIYTPSGWDARSHSVKGQNYLKEPFSQKLLKDGYTYQGYFIASRPNVPPNKLH